jgi:hypothetical protein
MYVAPAPASADTFTNLQEEAQESLIATEAGGTDLGLWAILTGYRRLFRVQKDKVPQLALGLWLQAWGPGCWPQCDQDCVPPKG